MTRTNDAERRQRTIAIVKAYPVGLLLIGTLLNYLVFTVNPIVVHLPSVKIIVALIIASVLLVINHTWLMTTTELTRVRFRMFATPEEWAQSEIDPKEVSTEALTELERHHNAHRNTTENTVYFALLAGIFAMVSPSTIAAQVWIVGFAVARLGYTYSYLAANTSLRGLFMSLSLLAMYGLASYLVISTIA